MKSHLKLDISDRAWTKVKPHLRSHKGSIGHPKMDNRCHFLDLKGRSPLA
jgi:transposase